VECFLNTIDEIPTMLTCVGALTCDFVSFDSVECGFRNAKEDEKTNLLMSHCGW
jgi:hypothetical protein